MQVIDLKTLIGTRDLVMVRRNPQAKVSLLEHFSKIMPNPMARAEVSGIVVQLAFKVGSPEEVGNPIWSITVR